MQVEPSSPERSDIDEDEEFPEDISPELRLIPRDSDKRMLLLWDRKSKCYVLDLLICMSALHSRAYGTFAQNLGV